jgi:hypothetical protein
MNRIPRSIGLVLAALIHGCGATDICQQDSDCATPHVCIEHVCQNPVPDAGTAPGSSDAGSHDAGHDAGSSDSGPPDAGFMTLDEFTQQELQIVCQKVMGCIGLGDGGIDETACVTPLSQDNMHLNMPLLVQEAVDAGKATYNAALAAPCLAALGAEDCSSIVFPQSWYVIGPDLVLPPGCDGLFAGTVPVGGSCVGDVECAPDSICTAYAADGGCGACTQRACDRDSQCVGTGYFCSGNPYVFGTCEQTSTLAAPGQPCDPPFCEPGYYCDTDLNQCLQQGVNGDGCPYGGPPVSCAEGFICTSGPAGNEYNGTCLPVRGLGESCDNADQCVGLNEVLCDMATETCVSPPESGPCVNGTACDFQKAYCDTTQSPPTCYHYIIDGASCQTGRNFPSCDPYSLCVPIQSGSTEGLCQQNSPRPQVCFP